MTENSSIVKNDMSQRALRPYSPYREFLRHFKRNKLAIFGAATLLILSLIAAVFWVFSILEVHFPRDPTATELSVQLQAPSRKHPFGTDQLGRDVLARMAHGTRISLLVGFVAVGVAITIGVFIGSIAGYFGRWVDALLMRLVDVVMCFPTFFLILTVVALLKPNFWNVMIVIGLTGWTGTARFVRAEILSIKERDYVKAIEAVGAKRRKIIFKHILPNALAPVLVSATLGVAGAILTEAGLSFLGFGVQPPRPTWGNILAEGRLYIFDAWWLTLFPGLAILITVLSFNLFGEGLRDAFSRRT